jgi:hypothetical protein
MPTKTHYVRPGDRFPVCGRSGAFPETTNTISDCTCNACIRTVAGKNAGGRPKREGGRNKIAIVLSDRAYEKFLEIPRGKRSKYISDYLES